MLFWKKDLCGSIDPCDIKPQSKSGKSGAIPTEKTSSAGTGTTVAPAPDQLAIREE